MYHIKREAWFGGAKLNGVNCRRLMDKNEDIINSIRDIFIEMNKGTVSENKIDIYCKETQTNFNRNGQRLSLYENTNNHR